MLLLRVRHASLLVLARSRQFSLSLAQNHWVPVGASARSTSVNLSELHACCTRGPYIVLDIARSYFYGWYLYQIQETVINAFLSPPDTA